MVLETITTSLHGNLIHLNKHLPDWGILATFCVVFIKQISTITRCIHERKPQRWQLKSKFDLFCWKTTMLLPGQPYQPTTEVLIQDKGTFIYFNSIFNNILPLDRSLSYHTAIELSQLPWTLVSKPVFNISVKKLTLRMAYIFYAVSSFTTSWIPPSLQSAAACLYCKYTPKRPCSNFSSVAIHRKAFGQTASHFCFHFALALFSSWLNWYDRGEQFYKMPFSVSTTARDNRSIILKRSL